MAGFLYFLDGWVNPVTLSVLGERKLAHAFDTVPAHGRLDRCTPSGRPGTILANEARLDGRDLSYRADEQVWHEFAGGLWVGTFTAAPPTPRDLIRDRGLAGKAMRLGDNRWWTIPRLAVYAAPTTDAQGQSIAGTGGFALDLPCYASLDREGKWVNGQVVGEYQPLADLFDRLYEGMVKAELGKARRLTTEELLDITVELLSVNYVVQAPEVSILQLLPIDEHLKEAAKVATDFHEFESWYEKKNAETALAGSAG